MKFLGILEFLNLEFLNLEFLNLEFLNLEFLKSRILKSRIPKFKIPRNSRILIFSFKRIKNELFLQKKVFA